MAIQVDPVGRVEPNPRTAVTRPADDSQTIEAAGGMLADIVQGTQSFRTRQMAQREADALDAARTVTENNIPVQEDGGLGVLSQNQIRNLNEQGIDVNDVQSQVERVQEEAGKSFSAIRSQIEQGGTKSGISLAQSRIESEMRRIGAMFPGFHDQVRETAKNTLGFDPTGSTMNRVFQVDEEDPGDLTQYEKDVRLMQSMPGVSDAAAVHWSKRKNLADIKQSAAKSEMDYSDSVADTMFSKWMRGREEEGENSILGFSVSHRARLSQAEESGEPLDYADTQAALNTIDMQKEQNLQDYLTYLETPVDKGGMGLTVSDEQEGEIRQNLDKKWEGVEEFVSDTENLKILNKHEEELQSLANLDAWENETGLMYMKEVWGEAAMSEFIKLAGNTTNTGQFSLMMQLSPTLREIFEQGNASERFDFLKRAFDQTITGNKSPITGNPQADQELRGKSFGFVAENLKGNQEELNNLVEKAGNSMPGATVSKVVADPDMWTGLNENNRQLVRRQYFDKYKESVDSLVNNIENPEDAKLELRNGEVVLKTGHQRDQSTSASMRGNRPADMTPTVVVGAGDRKLRWFNKVALRAFENDTLRNDFKDKVFNGTVRSKEDLVNVTNNLFEQRRLQSSLQEKKERINQIREDINPEDASDEEIQEGRNRISRIREFEIEPLREDLESTVNKFGIKFNDGGQQ